MSPVIVIAFVACGIVSLINLDVHSFSDFWNIWGEGSDPFPGQIKYTFWHVFLWSWFANAAMHIGMSDLSVFRFAKKHLRDGRQLPGSISVTTSLGYPRHFYTRYI